MWSPVVHPTLSDSKSVPRTRFKHACCLDPRRQNVYILGGRSANIPLKDFWAMDLSTGIWTLLGGRGSPVNAQEHSMVYYENCLYVFGGVFALANECPLWIYKIPSNAWNKWEGPKGATAPQSRKAHSAVVHEGYMFIYGGYQDMRGSLGEMWQFKFETREWKMIHGNQSKRTSELIPPARHRHTAVVFDRGVWVYGGMTDLQERSDLWRFDLISKRWSHVKCKYGPGPLHSHTAVRLNAQMLLLGGETQGNLSNEVWRFHFGTETWEKIEIGETKPTARSQLAAITVCTPWFADKSVKIKPDPVESRPEEEDSFNTQLPSRAKNGLRSRLSLGRSQGYQQVHTHDSDDLLSRPSAWLTKSSTYSLLSNLSNDSCLAEETGDEKAANNDRGSLNHARSESVQNFGSPTPCLIPRSQTAVRFNPFDPCKEVGAHPVRRDETFDVTTTSDYASEMDEPFHNGFVGISNPVYIGFSQFGIDESVENHRNFALALNNSLSASRSGKQADCKKQVLSQLIRLHESTDEARELPAAQDLEAIERRKAAKTYSQVWSIVTFGGREAGPSAPFDRPLSMWMLQI